MNKTLSRLASFAVMLVILLSVVPFRSYAVEVVSSDIKITDFTKPEGSLPVGRQNGDVQNSGNGLNASDALMIQQYLAGIITSLE